MFLFSIMFLSGNLVRKVFLTAPFISKRKDLQVSPLSVRHVIRLLLHAWTWQKSSNVIIVSYYSVVMILH